MGRNIGGNKNFDTPSWDLGGVMPPPPQKKKNCHFRHKEASNQKATNLSQSFHVGRPEAEGEGSVESCILI